MNHQTVRWLVIILVVYYALRQLKTKSTQQLSAERIGTVLLIYYPLAIIIIFGIFSKNLIGTGLFIAGYLLLIVTLLIFSSTFIIQYVSEVIKVSIGIIAKSLSILMTLIPILLIVILLSIFSPDFWLILGNITWTRLLSVIIILFIPEFILNTIGRQNEAKKIIGELPTQDEIPNIFSSIESMKKKFEKGLISDREWDMVKDDMSWRNYNKIIETVHPWLIKIIIGRLLLFSAITFILLILAFFIYFIPLFYILLTPEAISSWTNLPLTYNPIPFDILNISVLIPSSIFPIIKVSLALAFILAITAQISTLTDKSFRENVLSWLEIKARQWLAAHVIYDCVFMSKYQIWRYRVKNKKIFNVEILVKPGLEISSIEAACRAAASLASRNVYLIIVTCFEVNEAELIGNGFPRKHWSLTINRTKNIDQFNDQSEDISGIPEMQDSLGFELIDQNKEIPEDWFGSDSRAANLGKVLWENDHDHSLILHPYVHITAKHYILEIMLTRRLDSSTQYKTYIGSLLNSISGLITDFESISIQLYFRSTYENLASFDYYTVTNQVTYKDQLSKKYYLSKPEQWFKNNVTGE